MRLERVILPEVIYDQRGNPNIRKVYRESILSLDDSDDRRMMNAFDEHFAQNHGRGLGSAWLQGLTDTEHYLVTRYFEHCRTLRQRRPELYYVPSSFLKAIASVRHRAIRSAFLPKEMVTFVTFGHGHGIESAEGSPAEGVFIELKSGPAPDMHFLSCGFLFFMDGALTSTPVYHELAIRLKDGQPMEGPGSVFQNIGSVRRLHSLMDGKAGTRSVLSRHQESVLMAQMLNLVLYLHNEDEDILRLKPAGNLSNRQRREVKAAQSGCESLLSIPVRLVNFDFHQHGEREFSKDKTLVHGYMRAQHYGPQRSKLKHVWIHGKRSMNLSITHKLTSNSKVFI